MTANQQIQYRRPLRLRSLLHHKVCQLKNPIKTGMPHHLH